MTLDELTKAIAGARERSERVKNYLSRSPADQDRDDLLAVIDQLLPDARRLDWIVNDTSRNQSVRIQGCDERGWVVFDMADGLIRLGRGTTAREAIDRAIEGER